MTTFPLVLFGVAAVAGFVLFTGFPDRDIALLGIGLHRYFAFHSAAVPLVLAAVARKATRRRSLASLFLGLAAGAGLTIGVHLLTDVFQPKAVVFPFVGTLIKRTLLDDMIWLAGNAIASFVVTVRAFQRTAGRPPR